MPGPLKGVLRLSRQHLTQDQQDPVWGCGMAFCRMGCVPGLVDTLLVCAIEFWTILEADITARILLMRKLSC